MTDATSYGDIESVDKRAVFALDLQVRLAVPYDRD